MNLRHLSCALGAHRYVYAGVLLGRRLERCRHCGKVRAVGGSGGLKNGGRKRLRGARRAGVRAAILLVRPEEVLTSLRP